MRGFLRSTYVFAAAVALAACSSAAPTSSPVAEPPRSLDIDRAFPSDAAFYGPLAAPYARAIEGEKYASLRAATRAATAVVVARVVGKGSGREIGNSSEGGSLELGQLILEPSEILSGSLPDEHRDRLTVEFLGQVPDNLPDGSGVWLLRNKNDVSGPRKPGAPPLTEGEFYRLISSQGLFVQGSEGVENPVRERTIAAEAGSGQGARERPADPASAEAESFRLLSELTERVRSYRR